MLCFSACGSGNYDLSNSTDRAAMKVDIKQALTENDCSKALVLSTRLYESAYSDNETRMLYASANACNVGIQLYALLDNITSANFGSPDAIIKTFVRLFPSTSADSKMASSWAAQDALQTVLNPGAVIAQADQIAITNNPGSTIANDRTLDANTYLLFVGMSVVGTTLNRYGYTAGQTPIGLSYAQGQDLPWQDMAAVQADTTGAACATVSGFFNLFDGISAIVSYLSGSTSSQLTNIISLLSAGFDAAGKAECTTVNSFSTQQCTAAALRVRYRGACAEQAPAASFAAGVIKAINAGWQ